jgi:hypothetical protein
MFHKRSTNVPISNRNETKTFGFTPEFVLSKEIISIWSRRADSEQNRNGLFSIRQIREQYQNILVSFQNNTRMCVHSFFTLLTSRQSNYIYLCRGQFSIISRCLWLGLYGPEKARSKAPSLCAVSPPLFCEASITFIVYVGKTWWRGKKSGHAQLQEVSSSAANTWGQKSTYSCKLTTPPDKYRVVYDKVYFKLCAGRKCYSIILTVLKTPR